MLYVVWISFHLYGQPVVTFDKRHIQFAVRAAKSVWININRATLQHNKEFIMYIQFLGFYNDV